MWWLIWIVILFLLYLFNAIYKFLPEKLIKNHPRIKIIAIFIAIVLVVHFIVTEILAYINYSYALIAEDGSVVERRNFGYEVKTIDPPAYIIMGLSNPKNLTL
jgi:O-antigen ligase